MADMEYKNGALCLNKLNINDNEQYTIDDPENRSEILIDSSMRIISYRKSDGTKVENAGVSTSFLETNSLNLTDDGMTEFQKALKDSGFQPGGTGDLSDKDSIHIPIPQLAHFNIITDFNLLNLTKTSDVKCAVEFFDYNGNYFKKYIILNGQGRSSLSFLKKGLGADFFNEDPNDPDFDEDNVFEMKFGDWIYQDSFHIKSFYTDWPRCTTPIVYKLTNEVLKTRGIMADRPYKKYYVADYNTSGSAIKNTQSDLSHNMETGARCVPDGFPVIVYQNGEFWGVNSWQLKKHRDNYMLNKKKDSNIHLDGDMGYRNYSTCFWEWDGVIDWQHYCSGNYGIETRNPKNLCTINGTKYDVDTNDMQLAGVDNDNYKGTFDSSYNTPERWYKRNNPYLWEQPGTLYSDSEEYSKGDEVFDSISKTSYLSKNDGNIGNSLDNTDWWTVNYVYQESLSGYAKELVTKYDDHYFVNIVEGNTKTPAIVYDSDKDKWYNKDDDPDFKNKSKCGWVNCTTATKVRTHIEDLTTYVPTINRMATISTNNGDIQIDAYGGEYSTEKNFGKGIWVVEDGSSYMSIHSTNKGNPLSDDNFWVDITNTLTDVKETMKDMFDLESFIDYIVIGNVSGNIDCWDNNGQIITWGKLSGSSRLNWSVNMYDCDITFGTQWDGLNAFAANSNKLGSNYPLYKIFWNYYYEELKERYHELRNKGIFDADHITDLFREWIDRVGYDNYKKEYEKWPESPCFRDGNKTYDHYPSTGGFYGSIYRIYLWVKKRIEYMDDVNFFDYKTN